jgi:hypothetical protein
MHHALIWPFRMIPVSLIAVTPLAVWAATPGTHSVDILVDQGTAKGMVSIGDRKRVESAVQAGRLEDKPQIVLEPRDAAQLIVVQALPILFNYAAEITQTTPTSNYTAAIGFLEQIKSLAPPSATPGAKVTRTSPEKCRVTYTGLCLQDTLNRVSGIEDFAEVARDALLHAIAHDTSAVARDKERLQVLVKSLGDLTSEIEKINRADYDASMLATTKPSIGAWNVTGKAQVPNGAGPLADILDKNRDTKDVVMIVRRIGALVSHVRDLQDALALARDFEAAYRTALDDKAVGDTLTYDPANSRVQTFTVAANAQFSELFPPEVLKYQSERTGTFEIGYEPYERLSLSPGAGVVYSFVRNPEFAAQPIGATGQFSVVKEEEDYAALDGVIVLNITGSKWRLFGVHPFVQVGLVPSSDKLAILLGGGLQLFDRGALSMGAIYQRVDSLSDGLSEGSTITSADELKTDKEFKAGFFLSLAITVE